MDYRKKKKFQLKNERQTKLDLLKKLEKIRKEEIMEQYMKKLQQNEQQKIGEFELRYGLFNIYVRL